MYSKGEVKYQALALPDRVQRRRMPALQAAEAFRDYMSKRHSVRQYSDPPGARGGDHRLHAGGGNGAFGGQSPALAFRGHL